MDWVRFYGFWPGNHDNHEYLGWYRSKTYRRGPRCRRANNKVWNDGKNAFDISATKKIQPLYFAFTNCATKSAIILIENRADPWLEVKNRPIYEYWGKKAKKQIEMDPKLKDYIEQLKPETFEFESDDEE